LTRLFDDITRFIFVNDGPAAADLIFVPGCSHQALPEKAAELFKAGYAPYVLPSGKYGITRGSFAGVNGDAALYPGPYETECAFFSDVLIKNGVPRERVIAECESTFTMENGVFSRKICDGLGLVIKKAILCCKSYHSRRALIYYQCAFPDTEIYAVPVNVSGIGPDNWHKTRKGFDSVMSELGKCGSQTAESLAGFIKPLRQPV
jgi:uncharacterized SAM-binding protein YcdF (DUF218 family)